MNDDDWMAQSERSIAAELSVDERQRCAHVEEMQWLVGRLRFMTDSREQGREIMAELEKELDVLRPIARAAQQGTGPKAWMRDNCKCNRCGGPLVGYVPWMPEVCRPCRKQHALARARRLKLSPEKD